MPDETYEPLTPDHVPEVAGMLSDAFGMTPTLASDWLTKRRLEGVRRLARGGRTVATVTLIPMGAFYGGRSVPLTGIAGVAVAADCRGGGIARSLMAHVLAEMASSGAALSGLYSALHRLYRSVGYEQAHARFEATVPLAAFDGTEPPLARPATEADAPAIKALARRYSASRNGHLDRGEYIWQRILEPRGQTQPVRAFVFPNEAGDIEAYLYCTHLRTDSSPGHELKIGDMAATHARGWRRISAFLRGYTSVIPTGIFWGGPDHPLLPMLEERRFSLKFTEYSMVRVVDVRAALEGRGYPRGLRTEVSLAVDDPVFESNAGLWHVNVGEGRASATKVGPVSGAARSDAAGRGVARVSVRALAPLYTGLLSASRLAEMGWLEGDEPAIDALDAMFAGSTPVTPDFY